MRSRTIFSTIIRGSVATATKAGHGRSVAGFDRHGGASPHFPPASWAGHRLTRLDFLHQGEPSLLRCGLTLVETNAALFLVSEYFSLVRFPRSGLKPLLRNSYLLIMLFYSGKKFNKASTARLVKF